MSFDFSELVIPDEVVDYKYDYSQFLADPIYDWLNSPEEVLQVCDDIEEERKKQKKKEKHRTRRKDTEQIGKTRGERNDTEQTK